MSKGAFLFVLYKFIHFLLKLSFTASLYKTGCLYWEIIGMNINTNYGAAFAANAVKRAGTGLDSSIEKLSSGLKVNYAKDDAAGIQVAMRLEAEIQGLNMASKNAADAQAMLDTADGALAEVHSALLRMRELAVQAANSTVTDSDRDSMQAEVTALEAEIQRIGDNTTWGGQSLMDADFTAKFHIGPDAADNITVKIEAVEATTAASGATGGLGLSSDITTQANAAGYITKIDALSIVSTNRGSLGAVSNRLTSTINNLDQISVNLSASKGRIMDTDFAAETSNLARSQILQQAATAMLAQANASKSTALTLIQS